MPRRMGLYQPTSSRWSPVPSSRTPTGAASPLSLLPCVVDNQQMYLYRNAQLTLISDRSHGAASLKNGQLQVMLDRRCATDDGRGVGEVLPSVYLRKNDSLQSYNFLSFFRFLMKR